MAVSIGIQQPPLPQYQIGAPLAYNYLPTPHATTKNGAWASVGSNLSAPTLMTDETERYLRFTRTAAGPATLQVSGSAATLPAGSFDTHLWLRASKRELGCTLGLRQGTTSAGDVTGAAFDTGVLDQTNLYTNPGMEALGSSTILRTNNCLDPNGQNVLASLATSAQTTLSALVGKGRVTATASIPANTVLVQDKGVTTCAVGALLTSSCWVTNNTANTLTFFLQIITYQSNGTTQTGNSTASASPVTIAPGATGLVYLDSYTAPALTGTYRALLRMTTSAVMNTGDTLDYWGLTHSVGLAAHGLPMSGSDPAAGPLTYAFTGAANASTSTERMPTPVVTRTNLALNPTALNNAIGFSPNNSAINTVTRGVDVSALAHPQGIKTAVKGTMTAGHAATGAIFSCYNMHGLLAVNPALWAGVWVYTPYSNYIAYWVWDLVAKAIPIPPNTWTWVPSQSMNTANTHATLNIIKAAGALVTDDTEFVYVTGMMADSTYPCKDAVWGDRPSLGDFTYASLGVTGNAQSTERGATIVGATPTSASVSRGSAEFHAGASSARITTASATAAEGFIGTSTLGATHANVPVTVGAWVKAPAGALLYIVSRLVNNSLTDAKLNFTATGAWQWVAVTHPPDAAGTSVQVHVRTQTVQSITFYVDDITVTETADTTLDFSGATPLGGSYAYAWTGVANASTSVRYILGTWVEKVATVTATAASNWSVVLKITDGNVGDIIDIKLGSIMAAGVTPIVGDQVPGAGTTDFFYWEGAANFSRSIKAARTVTNAPGPAYIVDNLTTYTITEGASPLSPADTSGGATTVQLGIQEFPDSMLLSGGQMTVYEGSQALVQGNISAPSSDGSTVSITSMSIIAILNQVKRVPPFSGSLDGYITALLASVGITRPLNIDIGIAERSVNAPGFHDNVLTKLKEFCAVHAVELSDKGDAVYVRTPRARSFNGRDITQGSLSVDTSQFAQSIEVMNYNSTYQTNALIYPEATYDSNTGMSTPPGWQPTTQILTVDAGAVTIVEIPILGSLMSVEQPVCQKIVAPTDGALGSVYTVVGQGSNTANPNGTQASVETLDPAAWTARGGSVTVKIGDNYDSIIITITSGWNDPSLAPFAIAMSSGSGTYYSTLRIRGTGIMELPEKITYPTGLGPQDTTNAVGASIDSHYVESRSRANKVATETVPMYSKPIATLTGSTDDPGLAVGDIAGSRFQYGDAFYRVTSAPSGESGVSFTAVGDTTMDDFDAVWAGQTMDAFDAVWQTKTDAQFAVSPLRVS